MADTNVKHEVYEVFQLDMGKYAINGMIEFVDRSFSGEGKWDWDYDGFRLINDHTQREVEMNEKQQEFIQDFLDELAEKSLIRWVAEND